MSRRGPGGMPHEKAKDFKGSIKKLFKSMSRFRVLMIIAIILAATGSILSLITPNKMSKITDTVAAGIAPNTEMLTEVVTKITDNFKDQEKLQNKTYTILLSQEISPEDKQAFQNMLNGMSDPNLSEEEKSKLMFTLPDNIMLILLDEIEVNGTKISPEDELATLKAMATMNPDNQEASLKALDSLPKTVYKLIEPKIDMDLLKSLAIFVLSLHIIGAIFSYIQSFMLSTVSNKYAYNLRKSISKQINKLPLKYFDSHEMGDILSRVTNDVDTIAQHLNNSLATLVSSITLFVGSIIMMFYTNYIMAITAILASMIGFAFMSIILKNSQKYFNQKQIELGNLNGHIEEIYSGHNIVKCYNGEKEANEEFKKLNERLYNCNRKSQFLSGLMPAFMTFVGDLGFVSVCIVGAILTMKGTISFGVIVSFIIYVRQFTSPLSQMAQGATGLQAAAAAAERVFEFLDEKPMKDESSFKEKLLTSKAEGNIEFKNVKFGYDESRTIINDFSLKAKSGEKIAIVGPTGAGKTTMVNLLMKFYEINDGNIIIDGKSINELTRENIHELFTMVLQDTWLFEGTVRDNVKFNRSDISDEEIWNALSIVGVDHFVRTLPGGLDAKLDDSDSVSSGQKQLLTIARGMIKNSPFLILDEATSNVDTRTEELVQKAMDNLTIGRTSFIIAHRLSTIKNADLILVMNEGNVVEQGTHDELMNKNGFYAELYNSQFSGE